MKKFDHFKEYLSIISAIVVTFAVPAAESAAKEQCFKAGDGRILYSGRILRGEDGVSFDWSGVTVRIDFTGSYLKMRCSDSRCDWFNLWLDKEQGVSADRVLKTKGDGLVTIAEGLEYGHHRVILQKRTEGEQGCVTIKEFLSDGPLVKAENPFRRHIEFIGDSYTCGYGTEASGRDEPFRASEENCNLTYAAIIGRHFDAEVRTVCHSGRGIIRNYNDGGSVEETLPCKYVRTFDVAGNGESWKAGADGFIPDIVIIYLGTNDFSVGKQPTLNAWCGAYRQLLAQIKENYGEETPVLCVASKADELLGDYVRTAAAQSGMQDVHWTSIQAMAHDDGEDLGASWHPNYRGHRKVAACIIPYVSTITGWDMPVKAIE